MDALLYSPIVAERDGARDGRFSARQYRRP